MADARWLDLDAAAAYLSIRADLFLRRVKSRVLPAPRLDLGRRTPRWDRDALDAAMEGRGGKASLPDIGEAVNDVVAEIRREAKNRTKATG